MKSSRWAKQKICKCLNVWWMKNISLEVMTDSLYRMDWTTWTKEKYKIFQTNYIAIKIYYKFCWEKNHKWSEQNLKNLDLEKCIRPYHIWFCQHLMRAINILKTFQMRQFQTNPCLEQRSLKQNYAFLVFLATILPHKTKQGCWNCLISNKAEQLRLWVV